MHFKLIFILGDQGQLVVVRETRDCGKKVRHIKIGAIERCP